MASVTTTAAKKRTPARRGGRGRVLAAALDHVEKFPIFSPAHKRLTEAMLRGAPAPEIGGLIESDVGLAIATLRGLAKANPPTGVTSATAAVEVLGPARLRHAIESAPRYDVFEQVPAPVPDPEGFRLHALTVQRAADTIATSMSAADRDGIALAALLHDTGRIVLSRLHAGYAERFDRRLGTPEERIGSERREFGIDHALVGGVLARRWRLSDSLATTMERHHTSNDGSAASIVRLADMLAAHLEGLPVSHQRMLEVAEGCGIDRDALSNLLYELPRAASRRRRATAPCPLSNRELEVLRGLAEGKVYKQIALDLTLSASTVRSHLHNVYGKLGALDRAQAVLMATDAGWL
jgi:putative nucleotidyltransferase with HDIG domain